MGYVLRSIVLISCYSLLAQAAPRFYYESHSSEPGRSQACGDKLADLMYLVCSGRGYNVAFRPEGSHARRVRRGIVEECCRKSCSPAMLELYCLPDPTETPNVQIRKRSDSGVESTELHQVEDVTKDSTALADSQNKITQDKKREMTDSTTSITTTKESEENYKILNLLASSEFSTFKQNVRNTLNKSTPNDTTEEEQSNIPSLRHHKSRHHSLRRHWAHKAAAKTKRDKNMSNEGIQTFQIGTVKPYFAGRALAAYRSNYVHRIPVS